MACSAVIEPTVAHQHSGTGLWSRLLARGASTRGLVTASAQLSGLVLIISKDVLGQSNGLKSHTLVMVGLAVTASTLMVLRAFVLGRAPSNSAVRTAGYLTAVCQALAGAINLLPAFGWHTATTTLVYSMDPIRHAVYTLFFTVLETGYLRAVLPEWAVLSISVLQTWLCALARYGVDPHMPLVHTLITLLVSMVMIPHVVRTRMPGAVRAWTHHDRLHALHAPAPARDPCSADESSGHHPLSRDACPPCSTSSELQHCSLPYPAAVPDAPRPPAAQCNPASRAPGPQVVPAPRASLRVLRGYTSPLGAVTHSSLKLGFAHVRDLRPDALANWQRIMEEVWGRLGSHEARALYRSVREGCILLSAAWFGVGPGRGALPATRQQTVQRMAQDLLPRLLPCLGISPDTHPTSDPPARVTLQLDTGPPVVATWLPKEAKWQFATTQPSAGARTLASSPASPSVSDLRLGLVRVLSPGPGAPRCPSGRHTTATLRLQVVDGGGEAVTGVQVVGCDPLTAPPPADDQPPRVAGGGQGAAEAVQLCAHTPMGYLPLRVVQVEGAQPGRAWAEVTVEVDLATLPPHGAPSPPAPVCGDVPECMPVAPLTLELWRPEGTWMSNAFALVPHHPPPARVLRALWPGVRVGGGVPVHAALAAAAELAGCVEECWEAVAADAESDAAPDSGFELLAAPGTPDADMRTGLPELLRDVGCWLASVYTGAQAVGRCLGSHPPGPAPVCSRPCAGLSDPHVVAHLTHGLTEYARVAGLPALYALVTHPRVTSLLHEWAALPPGGAPSCSPSARAPRRGGFWLRAAACGYDCAACEAAHAQHASGALRHVRGCAALAQGGMALAALRRDALVPPGAMRTTLKLWGPVHLTLGTHLLWGHGGLRSSTLLQTVLLVAHLGRCLVAVLVGSKTLILLPSLARMHQMHVWPLMYLVHALADSALAPLGTVPALVLTALHVVHALCLSNMAGGGVWPLALRLGVCVGVQVLAPLALEARLRQMSAAALALS